MFCRFCGQKIMDDSTFCAYCGKNVSIIPNDKDTIKRRRAKHVPQPHNLQNHYKRLSSGISLDSLQEGTGIVSIVSLIIFLLFNIKMAPSYGWRKVLIYFITSGIVLGITVLLKKVILPNGSKSICSVFLVLSILTIIFTITLRIVYECKVDSVTTNIPSNGDIILHVSNDTTYYNNTGTGTIRDPSTSIRIGDTWIEDSGSLKVTLGEEYSLRISSGGSGHYGHIEEQITFRNNSFSTGEYIITKQIYIDDGPASLAKVKLSFSRYCTFWEVIFD